MLNAQVQAQNILSAETTYDLNEDGKKEQLAEEGIILQVGEKAHFKIREN